MIQSSKHIIGHTGYTATSLLDNTTSTCATTDMQTDSQPYTITRTCEIYTYVDIDPFIRREEIAEMREGWLKPYKKLKPGNNSKINYNLPRGRIREKKKIFLLKAA